MTGVVSFNGIKETIYYTGWMYEGFALNLKTQMRATEYTESDRVAQDFVYSPNGENQKGEYSSHCKLLLLLCVSVANCFFG